MPTGVARLVKADDVREEMIDAVTNPVAGSEKPSTTALVHQSVPKRQTTRAGQRPGIAHVISRLQTVPETVSIGAISQAATIRRDAMPGMGLAEWPWLPLECPCR